MDGNHDPLAALNNRWLRLAVGGVAGSLALLLAFQVGQDAAAMLFGSAADEADESHVIPLEQSMGPLVVAAPPARSIPAAPSSAVPAATLAAATITPAPAPNPAATSPADPSQNFTVKSILPIKDPIKFGQWFWQPERAPATGPVVITVDLAARVISVFRDGHEIGAAAILKGYSAKPTPLGTFPILMKDADHHSSLYDDAPMPFTMRLTGDGVSIHGTKVEKGYATNGCVGVPTPFAKLVFEQAQLGTPVIITNGKTAAPAG